MFLRLVTLLSFSILVAVANPACPKINPDEVTVHVVCHTHDDVGWLKTVDQYFYGANNSIQRAGVQYILDSVVDELNKDTSRKFSYVEMAFFHRWWMQQSDEVRQNVINLVKTGQLELVNGGWSMNDEAAAHYTAIVDQMTLGLVFINQTFGTDSRPRVAWQIDPFGHSNGHASLVAQMGFDGLFFGRLDSNDKNKRLHDKTMEMVWQPSLSLGKAAWLFTGALPNGYGPPSGFCFDDGCGDPPVMDDRSLEEYNVDERVADFLKAAYAQASVYRTNQLIMTMGSDFQYQNARTWYKNLDKLIKYVNAGPSNVTMAYSTPSCYLDAVHASQVTWGTKQDDFFPYGSDDHAYWTGYFTSRPTFKRLIRQANGFHQAQKQILALSGSNRTEALESMAQALGVTQHHDAVSGTAKQHVTDDYYVKLDKARRNSEEELVPLLRTLTGSNKATGEVSFCPQRNISACELTEASTSFQVVVYNSIARPIDTPVRIPVPSFTYEVTDYQGNSVTAQQVSIPDAILAIPYRSSSATQELVFVATAVPALGSATYQVTRTTVRSARQAQRSLRKKISPGTDAFLSNGRVSVKVDGTRGGLSSVSYVTEGGVREQSIIGEKLYYYGMAGDNSESSKRASGAYVFRPNGTEPSLLQVTNIVQYDGEISLACIKYRDTEVSVPYALQNIYGDVLSEIHVDYGAWASEVIRVYKGAVQVETEWLVGPIPIDDNWGKEVIVRYTVDGMTTNDTFYTDANGREMQKRVKDHRDTWEQNITEPVSWNYYPVTARILLESTNDMGSFVVLNDRAQGGSSLSDGQVELMVHRRLLHDDAFGVGEALNETAYDIGLIARGKHWLLHSDAATAECDFACLHRRLGEEVFMNPVLMFQNGSDPIPAPVSQLSSPLPDQVHLLTLEPWYSSGQFLLRLENMFQVEESNLSVAVTVDLENLFANITVKGAQETVLSANQWLADSNRLQWLVEGEESVQKLTENDEEEWKENSIFAPYKTMAELMKHYHHHGYAGKALKLTSAPRADLKLTLEPMQIRTFIITVEPSAST